MIHAVLQFLDRAQRFGFRILHQPVHELHVRRHFRVGHRPAPGARGEIFQQLFDIRLFHRSIAVQRHVTARRPLVDQRLELQAMHAHVGPGVARLEQHARHLHRPRVVHFLRHRLAIRARFELRRIIFLHQSLRAEIAIVRAVLPADPRHPSVIDPQLGTKRPPLAVAGQIPHLHRARGGPADTAIARVGHMQANLKRLRLIRLGQFIPWMFLVMPGNLHCHAVPSRDPHAAAQLARHQPTVAALVIALREQVDLLVKLLAGHGLDGALAQLAALHEGRGKFARLHRRLRAGMCGGTDGFLGGTEHELEQEIGHHQSVADVGKALVQFVLGKETYGIVALPLHAAVAVVVHEPAHCAGPIRRALQVQQIAQGAAQLEAVQAADDRLAAGAFTLRVGQLQPRAEGVDKLGGVRALGLRSFLGRHFAEVQLIQRILPNLQRTPIGEVRAQCVEPNFVLLLVRPVTLNAVRAQKRFQRIERLVRTRLTKRPDDGKQQEKRDAARAVHDFRSRPVNVPVLVPKRSASTPKFCSMDSSRFAAGTRCASSSG